jgi:hypothetical protein
VIYKRKPKIVACLYIALALDGCINMLAHSVKVPVRSSVWVRRLSVSLPANFIVAPVFVFASPSAIPIQAHD